MSHGRTRSPSKKPESPPPDSEAAFLATYDATVYINTPLTVDDSGNVFFGFVVTGANPAGLVSGIARWAADGTGRWVGAALAAYDVLVTNTRPPEYISYVMLMADDAANEDSQSFTCTSAGINCAARQRNDIAFSAGSCGAVTRSASGSASVGTDRGAWL